MSKKSSSSSLGVFIILIGIVMLLVNFNVLKLSMFWGIVHLWPLLLVVAGISILFRGSKNIGIILWLAFFGIIIGYSYLNMDEKTWFFGQEADNVMYEGNISHKVVKGNMDIDIRQGTFNVISSDSDDIKYSIPEEGISEAYVESKLLRPTLIKIEDNDFKGSMKFISKRTYDVYIPESGEWSLNLDAGVISGKLDFSDVKLKDLDINTGVLDIDLFVGEESEGEFTIDSGVGDVLVVIPEDKDIGIRVYSDGGLKSVEIDDKDFKKNGDTYISLNYDDAKYKIDLTIDLGVGTVEVKFE